MLNARIVYPSAEITDSGYRLIFDQVFCLVREYTGPVQIRTLSEILLVLIYKKPVEVAGALSRFENSRKNKLKAQDEILFVNKTTEKGEKICLCHSLSCCRYTLYRIIYHNNFLNRVFLAMKYASLSKTIVH